MASFAVLVACGGSVERVGSSGGGSSSSSSSSGGGSSSGSSGESRGESQGQCTLAPACDLGDVQISTSPTPPDPGCPKDATCYSKQACGATVWCVKEAACTTPACPTGYTLVSACVPDSDCKTVTGCNGKVSVVCQACESPEPVCDPGDTQVKSSADCPDDDVRCYSRAGCGKTIWCWGF